MNKKLLVVAVTIMTAVVALAHGRYHSGSSWGPRHQVGYSGYHRGVQYVPNHHVQYCGGHYHHTGMLVGGVVGAAVVPTPTYVATPTVVQQNLTGAVYVPSQAVYVNGVQVTGVRTAPSIQVTTAEQRWYNGQYLIQNGQLTYVPGHWE